MRRKPTTPKSDTSRRVLRTGFQALSVQALIQLYNAFSPTDITTDQAAILTVVGTPLISFIQNYLESHGAVPEMLKGKPAATPPADDLTRRELNALAAATGDQHNRLDRIENMMLNLRADHPPVQSGDPGIFTEQANSPARSSSATAPRGSAMVPPWPTGGLG